jgi:hypothetical protein
VLYTSRRLKKATGIQNRAAKNSRDARGKVSWRKAGIKQICHEDVRTRVFHKSKCQEFVKPAL